MLRIGMTFMALAGAAAAEAGTVETQAGPMQISVVADGLDEPWGLDFLPDGRFLLTERDRVALWLYDGAERQAVAGLPQVTAGGQGGLLDVRVAQDFATSRVIWLTYSTSPGMGAALALARARLSDDGTRLEEVVQVFTGSLMPGGRHFGARVVQTPDGDIWLMTGERGTGPGGQHAQMPDHPEGKVFRFAPDGTPLPAAFEGGLPGAVSLGHRNPQGATVAPDGSVWLVEHGPQGGDELNRVEAGRNYGWPVVTWGEQYGGGPIGEGGEKPGMEPPLHYWVPSIAPSGLMIYSGALVPEWKGDFFTGSLNSDFLSRLDPDSAAATGMAEERIAAPETGRVRDVREAPDGSIWFLSVTEGAVLRLAP